jgi:hypothetical protein
MFRSRTSNLRREKHIQGGGKVFLPQRRMRQIRFEEAVLSSQVKREGLTGQLHHMDCSCGAITCKATPYLAQGEDVRPEGCTETPVVKVVPKVEEPRECPHFATPGRGR